MNADAPAPVSAGPGDPIAQHRGFFDRIDEIRFAPTPLTRGPWSDQAQHGGPPAALLARAFEQFPGAEDFQLARFDVELLRPVPLDTLQITIKPQHLGRSVERLTGRLLHRGKPVMTARGLRLLRRPVEDPPQLPLSDWPAPDSLPPYSFTFFQNEVAYHRAVDLRLAHGAWGRTPIGFWARPKVPLVVDEPTSAWERLVILADAQSGMGVPLDPTRYTFLNPDLTVHLARAPEPLQDPHGHLWFGYDIRSQAGLQGTGLAQSALRDARGALGRSAQSLLVRPR